jgi:hypothetical protein
MGFQSAVIGSYDFAPTNHGLLGWSFDPRSIQTAGVALSSGFPYLSRILVPHGLTVSNIWCAVMTGGSGLTSSQCFAGLYDPTGARLAITADMSTTWNSTGIKSMALTGSVGVTLPWLWVALLSNGTTGPAMGIGPNPSIATANVHLSAANSRSGYLSAGSASSLPTSFTPATAIAQGVAPFWVGIS